MNILIYARPFYPSIGGIEVITKEICDYFSQNGHNVCLLTDTTCPSDDNYDKSLKFRVIRKPSFLQTIKEVQKSDVFMHQGPSLKMLYPVILMPWTHKKLVFCHHMCRKAIGFKGNLIKLICNVSNNIAVSDYAGKSMEMSHYKVIHNSFNSNIFFDMEIERTRDFAYYGNISVQKGCLLLIEAFEKFKKQNNSPAKLYFIGGLQEYSNCVVAFADASPYRSDILFINDSSQENSNKFMNTLCFGVLPTVINEAFGMSAVEMMAAGLIVIGTDGDGLEEAIGDNRMLFKKGNVDSLAGAMMKLYSMDDQSILKQKNKNKERLAKLHINNVGKEYERIFESIIK